MTNYNDSYEVEEIAELQDVLEPYQHESWNDDDGYSEENYSPDMQNEYPEAYLEGYENFYGEEYSDEHEEADTENRFRIAMGVVDLISICLGIVVILVLVAMLLALFDWLKTDILHSALLLQSGLQ